MAISLIGLSLGLAILAFVHACVLTRPGMILAKVYEYLEPELPAWLFKPLIGCPSCVAGQLALWSYLLLPGEYSLVEHGILIGLTIYWVPFVARAYRLVGGQVFEKPARRPKFIPPELNQNND